MSMHFESRSGNDDNYSYDESQGFPFPPAFPGEYSSQDIIGPHPLRIEGTGMVIAEESFGTGDLIPGAAAPGVPWQPPSGVDAPNRL